MKSFDDDMLVESVWWRLILRRLSCLHHGECPIDGHSFVSFSVSSYLYSMLNLYIFGAS